MAFNQPSQGTGAVHTTTTQNPNISSSRLNTSVAPATTPAKSVGRKPREKVFPCTWDGCSQKFTCPHNVQQHIREKHTFEKPFKCDVCAARGVDKGFPRQYGLNRHMIQIHNADKKASRAVKGPAVDDSTVTATPEHTGTSQTIENDQFRDMAAQLTKANAEMDAVSAGVEMSDVQFQFDEELSDGNVSGVSNSGRFACGECGYAAATQKEILMHMHASHQAPNTPFCSCSICTTMFITCEEDAIKHAAMLRNGGFPVKQDVGFSQVGPSGAMPQDWFSQPNTSHDGDWSDVDPALLSSSYT